MHTASYSRKIALAALLTTVAGACAHMPTPHSGTGSLSTYPAITEPESALAEAKEISHAAEHTRPQPSGLVVHIDPLTGQILPKAPLSFASPVPDPQQLQSAPIAAPQAVEVLSPVLGGGVKVKLHGQFHQSLFAIVDGDGNIRFEHRPAHYEFGVK
jgi:hypothetical protein